MTMFAMSLTGTLTTCLTRRCVVGWCADRQCVVMAACAAGRGATVSCVHNNNNNTTVCCCLSQSNKSSQNNKIVSLRGQCQDTLLLQCRSANKQGTSNTRRLSHQRFNVSSGSRDGGGEDGDIWNRIIRTLAEAIRRLAYMKAGIRLFAEDAKEFFRILYNMKYVQDKPLYQYTRREHEIYRQFSMDLPVVLLLSMFIFAPGSSVLFPVWIVCAFFAPRLVMSHHMWPPDSKAKYRIYEMKKKLSVYRHVLKNLKNLDRTMDTKLNNALNKVLKKSTILRQLTPGRSIPDYIEKLLNKHSLSTEEVLQLLPVFESAPYHFSNLPLANKRLLKKVNGFSMWHLERDALLLHYMDEALGREGLMSLNDEELDRACIWRGLYPDGLGRNEKRSYLEKWTFLSHHSKENISFLLHLPVFLSYSHPNNLKLLMCVEKDTPL